MDKYNEYMLDMTDYDFVENLTEEQREKAIKVITDAVNRIIDVMTECTHAVVEGLNKIDWVSLSEALKDSKEK